MKRRKLLVLVGVPFLIVNFTLLVAAMPKQVTDRVVNKIMDWGDKHVGGPFTKGGGDEGATRTLISDLLDPPSWYKAFWDLTVGAGQSSTATPQQDAPPSGKGQTAKGDNPANHTNNKGNEVRQAGDSSKPKTVIPPVHSPTPDHISDNRTEGHYRGDSEHRPDVPTGHISGLRGGYIGGQPSSSSDAKQGDGRDVNLKAGEHPVDQMKDPKSINPNAEGKQPSKASVSKSTAPAPHPSPQPTRSGGNAGEHSGGNPMDGAKEIDRGKDKKDTPGNGPDKDHEPS